MLRTKRRKAFGDSIPTGISHCGVMQVCTTARTIKKADEYEKEKEKCKWST